MAQDPGHDGGLGEEGDDLPWAAAGGAAEDVDGKDPLEKCGPVEAAGEDRGRDPGRRDDADVVGNEGRHSGNHVAAAVGVGSEDAVISEGVSSRRRDESGGGAKARGGPGARRGRRLSRAA